MSLANAAAASDDAVAESTTAPPTIYVHPVPHAATFYQNKAQIVLRAPVSFATAQEEVQVAVVMPRDFDKDSVQAHFGAALRHKAILRGVLCDMVATAELQGQTSEKVITTAGDKASQAKEESSEARRHELEAALKKVEKELRVLELEQTAAEAALRHSENMSAKTLDAQKSALRGSPALWDVATWSRQLSALEATRRAHKASTRTRQSAMEAAQREQRRLAQELAQFESDYHAVLEQKQTPVVILVLKILAPIAPRTDTTNVDDACVFVSYMINSGDWSAAYDVHLNTETNELKLDYNALVRLHGGPDLRDIELTLSTTAPRTQGKPPELTPWRCSVRDKTSNRREESSRMEEEKDDILRPMRRTMARTMNALSAGGPASNELAAAPMAARMSMLNEQQQGDEADENNSGNGATLQFVIAERQTIKADGEVLRVPLTELRFEASLSYITVPALQAAVYAQATIVNRSPYLLLEGKGTLFMNGDYITSTNLARTAIGEKVNISFGVDSRVEVRRQLVQEQRSSERAPRLTMLMGKVQLAKYSYRTTITNKKHARQAQSTNDSTTTTSKTAAEPQPVLSAVDESSGTNTRTTTTTSKPITTTTNESGVITVTVKERIPVSKDDKLIVRLTQPKANTLTAEAQKALEEDGEVHVVVRVAPGETVTCPFSYEVEAPAEATIYGMEHLIVMGAQRTRHGAIDLASLVHLDTVPALEGPVRHAVPSSRTTKQPKARPTVVTATQQRRQRNDDEEGEVLVYDKNMYRDEDNTSNDSGSDVRTADTSDGMTRSSNNSSITQVHTTSTSKSVGQRANPIQGAKKSDRVSARRLFTALCTCYWAAFGEAEMSIVPDAHATHCPCRWQIDDYVRLNAGGKISNEMLRIEHKERDEQDTIDLSSDTSSSTSSSSAHHIVARRGRAEIHRHASTDKQREARGRKDEKPHRKRHHQHTTRNTSASPQIHLDASVLQVSTRKTTETRSPAARRGVSIGRAPRMPTAKSCSPGPGAYEVVAACDALGTVMATHESAPRTVRSVFVSRSARSLPYDKTTITKTTESEEAGERGKTTRVVSPGPASYDISRAFQAEARHVSPPAYHFSRAPRITTTTTLSHHGAEDPGPASYDIQAVTDMAAAIMQAGHKQKGHSSSLTHTFSAHETRLAVCDNGVPGPGTYDIAPRPHSCTQPQHNTSPHENDAGGRSKKMIGTTFGTAERAVCSTTPTPLDASEVQTRRSSTPGPGAYDVAAAALHEARISRAPQWSMGTSGRETRPGFLMQSKTREEEAALMPGPGQYLPIFTSDDIAHTSNSVTVAEGSARRRATGTFGTASRGLLPETAPPSPRYLHLTDDDYDGEGYSSAHGGERDVSPGPGAYDVTRSASADAARRAVRMRTAPRLTWIEQLAREPQGLPGPASYDVKDDLVRHRTSGPVMGTATATREGMIEGYDKSTAEVPGPGAYDVALSSTVNETHRRGAVIGTATRGLRWTQNGDGAALTLHAALSHEEEKDNVGPGSYSLPALPRGAAFTIAGKSAVRDAMIHTDEESAAMSPGPGAYSPQLSLVQPQPARVVLHSTSSRFAHELRSEKDGALGEDGVPGPGAYDTVQKERSVSAGRSFPTAPRMTWPQNDVTGELHGQGGAEWRANVGPGSYEVERAATSGTTRGVVFAHAPRFTDIEGGNAAANGTRVPGPGAYDVAGAARHVMNAPAVGFTTAPRELYTDLYGVHEARVQAGATVPGPGAYDPQLQLRYPSTRAVTMAQRGSDGERRAGAEIPGPGAYEVSNAASQYVNAPRYGFGSAPRETLPHEAACALAAQTPGPGAYEPQQTTYSRSGGDAVRFATAPRVYSHVMPSDTPGPGSYNLQSISDNRTGEGNTLSSATHAVRFTTAPRVLYSDSNLTGNATSPGPGAYDPQRQLVLPREPQPSRFGTAARPTSIDIHAMRQQSDEATPGPGQYHTAVDTMSLPGYRGVHLGAAPQSRYTSALHKESSEGPGPGAYNPQDVIQQPHAPALAFPTAPRNTKSTTAPSMTNVNMSADVGRDDTPGPGAYDAQDTLLSRHRTAPTVSLGTSARFAFTPPSQYEHEEQVKPIESVRERPTAADEGLPRAPAYSFARADRGLMSSHSVAEGPDYVAVWPSRATSHVAAPAEQHQLQANIVAAQRTVQHAPGNDAAAGHARRPEKHVRFLLHDTQSEGSARREASPHVTMRDESPGPGSYDLRSEREQHGRPPVRHIEEVRSSTRQSPQPRNAAYSNTTSKVVTRRDERLYTMPYSVAHTEQQQRRNIEPQAVTAGVEERFPSHVQQPLPVPSPMPYHTMHVTHDVAPQQRDARTLERLIQAGYPVSGQRQAEAALIDAMPL